MISYWSGKSSKAWLRARTSARRRSCWNAIHPNRLREMRESWCISQYELAKSLGVHQTTYGSYETGSCHPAVQPGKACRLLRHLHRLPDWALRQQIGRRRFPLKGRRRTASLYFLTRRGRGSQGRRRGPAQAASKIYKQLLVYFFLFFKRGAH